HGRRRRRVGYPASIDPVRLVQSPIRASEVNGDEALVDHHARITSHGRRRWRVGYPASIDPVRLMQSSIRASEVNGDQALVDYRLGDGVLRLRRGERYVVVEGGDDLLISVTV